MKKINVWLLVYLIASLPVLAYYSAALAGWLFDYPMGLFIGIFVLLAVPLVLMVLQVPSAPDWNIAGLWLGAGLISVRVLYGWYFADEEKLTNEAVLILSGTVCFATAWATGWTIYFLHSDHVAETFGSRPKGANHVS